MPSRGKSICRKIGCNTLIDSPGYCLEHAHANNAFTHQNNIKTIKTKRFYSSGSWTRASREHRIQEPLCQECLRRGVVKSAEMVHHEPPLEILMDKGLNPLDHKYLQSLCNNCHLGHLRAKKRSKF